jgi:hypothetical protein
MPLTRPAEPKWHWKQPRPPFPECPGANGAFLGPSGSGKSYALTSLLLTEYKKVFKDIHVFSPSFGLDNIWDAVEKHARGLETAEFKSSFHDKWDEEALSQILQKQRARVTRLKLLKSQDELPQICVILDDLADTGAMHQAHNTITALFLRGRHQGVSTWLSVQKLSTIHPTARANFAFILCWALRNKKELWDGLIYELSNVADPKTLLQMYNMATSQLHSFWYVNLRRLPAEFYINFDERLVVDKAASDDPPDEPAPKRFHSDEPAPDEA